MKKVMTIVMVPPEKKRRKSRPSHVTTWGTFEKRHWQHFCLTLERNSGYCKRGNIGQWQGFIVGKWWGYWSVHKLVTSSVVLIRSSWTQNVMLNGHNIPIAIAFLKETKLDFQRKIKETHAWHEIPEEHIINFDKTPLPYNWTENRTYCEKGPSNMPLLGKGKKEAEYWYL